MAGAPRRDLAERLVELGAAAALVTGGHGETAVDHLFDGREHVELPCRAVRRHRDARRRLHALGDAGRPARARPPRRRPKGATPTQPALPVPPRRHSTLPRRDRPGSLPRPPHSPPPPPPPPPPSLEEAARGAGAAAGCRGPARARRDRRRRGACRRPRCEGSRMTIDPGATLRVIREGKAARPQHHQLRRHERDGERCLSRSARCP